MTIDEALVLPGDGIAVWDRSSVDGSWLGVYRTGPAGATLLAWERLGPSWTDAVAADLLQRGIRVGGTDGHADFIWVFDELGCGVWSSSRCEASGTRSALRLMSGVVNADAVEQVVSFIADGDLGHRGVRLDLRDGGRPIVAEERDPAADLDPTYDRYNVMIDAAWATFLGRELAGWLGVPHRDELP